MRCANRLVIDRFCGRLWVVFFSKDCALEIGEENPIIKAFAILVVMSVLAPLKKVLPFGEKKERHEPGDPRAALAGHRAKPDTDAG